MSNETPVNNTDSNVGELEPVVKYIWISGLVLSSLCLILQLVLFKIMPRIRKIDQNKDFLTDQKILIQLTVARLMNTLIEYMLSDLLFNKYTEHLTYALYFQTDAILISWMFVYTKNLYDRVVLVFAFQKCNFVLLSVLIWTLTIPVGMLCPVFLAFQYDYEYYKTYAWLKFIILSANLLFFCRIFYVIINRNKNRNRNFTDIIKTCVISFILVCITSLQVFLTDILSYLEVGSSLTNTFCILNSFQAIAVTIIFLILTKNCRD